MVPDTVQTGAVAEVNATVSPLEAVAEMANVPVPRVRFESALKVMAWLAL